MRKKIDLTTLRVLYAHSHNKCAFPNCSSPIFEDDGTYTGICCHIESYSPNGPRYNNLTTVEEKNSYDNLILLCSRHHTIIDANMETYSVEALVEMKNNHKEKLTVKYRLLDAEMLNKMLLQLESFYARLKNIDDIYDHDHKMTICTSLNTIENIKVVESLIEELFSVCEDLKSSDEKIIIDLEKLLLRINVDKSLLDKVPYYENSLSNRNWETHNLRISNLRTTILMNLRFLKISIIKDILMLDKTDVNMRTMLMEQQYQFEEFYKKCYYSD